MSSLNKVDPTQTGRLVFLWEISAKVTHCLLHVSRTYSERFIFSLLSSPFPVILLTPPLDKIMFSPFFHGSELVDSTVYSLFTSEAERALSVNDVHIFCATSSECWVQSVGAGDMISVIKISWGPPPRLWGRDWWNVSRPTELKTVRYWVGKGRVGSGPASLVETGSSISIKKIQSASNNVNMNSHSMFQRENKNCIDLEVIVLLLAEDSKSF